MRNCFVSDADACTVRPGRAIGYHAKAPKSAVEVIADRAVSKKPLLEVVADSGEWLTVTALMRLFKRHDGRVLGMQINETGDGAFGITALETNLKARELDDVLDDHGHKTLGKFATLDAAKKASKKFAARWKKSGKSVEACACEEIPVTKRRRKA